MHLNIMQLLKSRLRCAESHRGYVLWRMISLVSVVCANTQGERSTTTWYTRPRGHSNAATWSRIGLPIAIVTQLQFNFLIELTELSNSRTLSSVVKRQRLFKSTLVEASLPGMNAKCGPLWSRFSPRS